MNDNPYPRGKLNDSDEGAINISISVDQETETVLINFGKEISWVGFDKATAIALSMALMRGANKL